MRGEVSWMSRFQEILDRVLGYIELFGGSIGGMQRLPVARRHLPVRAVVMEHAQADVGEQALGDHRRLCSHAGRRD